MKKYRILVTYSTQRGYIKNAVTVEATDGNEAQIKACGIIWINEHVNKDRYIKIHDIVVVEE